ncbi:MAG: FimB/Mfa2 family fimbrial subunit [Prevotella sp.]|nr:FimB/Mfa2 family fimbrial subunit [Prevotella sp.]
MKKNFLWTLAILPAMLFSACEKGYTAEEVITSDNPQGNIILRVKSIEMIPFENTTRATTTMEQLCNRLQFAVFKNGEKVKNVSQQQSDANFGETTLTLAEGEYQLVVMGHSCTGSATITDLEKITFPSNKVTDTFYYYGTFTVGSNLQIVELELHRAVAMVRFSLSKPLASNIKQLKFYYTGGSSTFSAISGYGSVNSKQTEIRDVTDSQNTFEIFTFPHSLTGQLKVTITAIDANGTEIAETVMEDVPIEINKISRYEGPLFEGAGTSASPSIKVKADGEWGGTISVN